jgi:1,4-dihydroxy-2-naphthoate octaprenyltransferase
MEVAEPLVRRSPVTMGKLLRAVRAFSLPVSVGPVFVAVAAAVPAANWNWPILLASAAGAGLLHLGGNLLNDYFDFLNKVDRRTHDDDLRPGRLLVHRQLLPRDVLVEAAVCMSLALALGLYLISQRGLGIFWFGLAGAAGGYIYTGWPFKLKYRALGEVVIFLVFGPLLLVGAAWAQTGRFELPALLASIPVGLATTAVLVGNNVRDRDEDSGAAILTIGRFAGGRFAQALYVFLVVGAGVGLAAIGACGAGPRGLLAAPLALVLIFKPALAVWKGRRIPDIDAQTARFEAILLALALIAYVVRW